MKLTNPRANELTKVTPNNRFFGRGISRSILLRFLIISILPTAFITIESIRVSTKTIKADQFKTLTVLEKSIYNRFNEYINSTITNIGLQAELANTSDFLHDLKSRFKQTGYSLSEFIQSHHWHNLQAQYGTDFSRFLTTYQYTDVLLLDDQGNILYSSHQYSDLGTNLFFGELKHSKMAKAATKALKTGEAVFSDLETYPPVDNQISGFIFQAVIDENNRTQGLLAIHLGSEFIQQIVHLSSSLDQIGQTFIVGQDLLMRSNSQLSSQPTLLKRKIINPMTLQWQKQLHSTYAQQQTAESVTNVYTNHNGVEVFGSYLSIDFAGTPLLIVTEVSQKDALEPITQLTQRLAYIVLITLCLVVVIAIYSARSITSPIIELTAWARQIAQGRLISQEIKTPLNEIGVLNKTFVELVDSLQEVVSNIEALSLGHLGQKIAPKSKDDVLVLSLNHLNKAMYSIVSQAETIADGSYVTNIKPRSNNDLLGNALVKMTENLRKADLHNVEQDWIKTSQAELSKIINGDKDLDTLANEVICYITKRVNGQVGTIYVVDYPDNHDTLLLQGSYAIAEHTKTSISLGEGLVGQAAKEQTFILLQELPQDYLYVNSTLGHAAPKSVVIFPFSSNDKLSAVIEIASLGCIDEKHLEFIRLASESVAIAFKSCFIRVQTENLLEETRKQSDELKYQKEELRISNETLRTNTQTLEAQQKVLEKAQIQALEKAVALEEASKYKSEFLANMSHELRTPLNSLLILARSLAENDSGNLSSDEIESAEVILDSGQHLLELINDVLDLSKIEAGQMTIHYEEVYLSELAGAMRSRFKHMAEEKNLIFDIHIDNAVPASVISDNVKVAQILTNLLSNAIKFTSEGKVSLSISLRQPNNQNNPNSPTLAFDVSDTGVGIATSKHEAIFSAFVQEDGSISRNYGGTGLGLSIVTSLAKLLGAEVELNSQPSLGSTFSFYLPLRTANPATDISSYARATAKPIEEQKTTLAFKDDRAQINSHKPLLLIIEDDNKFAKILFNACHKLDCQAIVCPDGESGLNILQQYQVDGVILDYMLPGLDGEAILNQIKTNETTANTPVHVISALSDLGNMTKLGALGQTVKPINSSDLVKMIQEIIAKVDPRTQTDPTAQAKVLIVEDDMSALFATRKLLQDEQVNNTGVGSATAALEHLRLEPFDVMILDLQLPDMSGFKLLEAIAADEKIAMPAVIIYSGRDLNDLDISRLAPFTDNIIIKTTNSGKQLLDEVRQFVSLLGIEQPQVNPAPAETEVTPEYTQQQTQSLDEDAPLKDFELNNILLVDDDMRNTFALAKVLRKHNLEVTIASSGRQCLDILGDSSQNIELVLMDISMPKMDGFETMRRIRQQLGFEQLPLIAITANAMPEDKQKCIASGANDYMSKPVDIEQLLTKITKWL